jgi:hypothetical protein
MARVQPNPAMRRIRAEDDYQRGLAAGRKEASAKILAVANGTEDKPLTLDEVKVMTPDEVNARWNAVSEVLARAEAAPTDSAA